LLVIEAALPKALERRLIAGCRRDIGARDIVVVLDLADELGILQQQLRRPERIAQVGPAAFELRREGAVEHDDVVLFKKWCKGIYHKNNPRNRCAHPGAWKRTAHQGGDVGRISSYSERSSVSL